MHLQGFPPCSAFSLSGWRSEAAFKFVLCETGKRQLQRRGDGRGNQLHKQQQEGTGQQQQGGEGGGGGVAGDPIKIFDKQCSTPSTGKNMR